MINHVNIPIVAGGTLAVGTTYVGGFRVPNDDAGGGITVLNVDFFSANAIAAASAPTFELVTLGTDSAVNGTISTATGSVAWTAGTVKAGTLSTVWIDEDDDHAFVAVKHSQTTGAENAAVSYINCLVQYVQGH